MSTGRRHIAAIDYLWQHTFCGKSGSEGSNREKGRKDGGKRHQAVVPNAAVPLSFRATFAHPCLASPSSPATPSDEGINGERR